MHGETVRTAPTPAAAKKLGRVVKVDLESWDSRKYEVMKRGLRLKFTQHKDLAEQLVKTYPSNLLENSPTDNVWGVGKAGTGTNLLGKALVEIRGELA